MANSQASCSRDVEVYGPDACEFNPQRHLNQQLIGRVRAVDALRLLPES